jgi:hypothetical protein
MSQTTLNRLLLAAGIVLSLGWLYFYALPTFRLAVEVLNNEPYYIDVVSFYLLPYAIAPFVAISYLAGTTRSSESFTLQIKQWFMFLLLTCFALLQLLDCLAFASAFISTFTVFEPIIEWLWLFLPIGFFTFFILLVRFLFQTRHSLKSIQVA